MLVCGLGVRTIVLEKVLVKGTLNLGLKGRTMWRDRKDDREGSEQMRAAKKCVGSTHSGRSWEL